MKTKEFSFPSSSDLCDIKCKMYIPDGEIKYILQIVHGMQEYFGRYDAFATFLASKNVLVVIIVIVLLFLRLVVCKT